MPDLSPRPSQSVLPSFGRAASTPAVPMSGLPMRHRCKRFRLSDVRPFAVGAWRQFLPRTTVRAAFLAFAIGIPVLLGTGAASADVDAPRLAADYLKRAQAPDGLFRYEYDFLKGRYSSKNNVVRQAGAGLALAEYLLHSRDDSVRITLTTALRAYATMSIPIGDGKLLSPNGTKRQAKIGATALALLSELLYFKATGDKRFETDRLAWLKGLLHLRLPGKGFARIPDSSEQSPYANGEIWLTLAHYHALFPGDQRVHRVLRELDLYLIEHYGNNPDVAFFHWGAMAAAKRYETTKEPVFLDFAVRQTIDYLDNQRPKVKPHVNSCYAVEGLASVAAIIDGTEHARTLKTHLVERITAEMTKNLGLQIVRGQQQLRFRDDTQLHSHDLADFAGAFVNGLYRPQTRIDFTQHCLSAMIKCQKHGIYCGLDAQRKHLHAEISEVPAGIADDGVEKRLQGLGARVGAR